MDHLLRAIALSMILMLVGCLKPVLPTVLPEGAISGARGPVELFGIPLHIQLGDRRSTQMLPASWAKVQVSVSGGRLKGTQTYLYNAGTSNPASFSVPASAFQLPLNDTLTLAVALQTSGGVTVANGQTTVSTPNSPGLVNASLLVAPVDVVLTSAHPSIANAGTLVTLEGNFPSSTPGNYTVNFPGLSGGASQANPGRLTAAVPTGAGVASVSVTYNSVTSNGLPFRTASFALGVQRFETRDSQTSMPAQDPVMVTPRADSATVVIGSFLYALGGVDNANTALSSVERAPILADGKLGPFQRVAGVSLATARSAFSVVRLGDRLYVIGGRNGSAPLSSGTIESAPIDASGNLTATFQTGTITGFTPRFDLALAVAGQYLYALGGDTGGSATNTVERAIINQDGSLGSFQAVPGVHLESARKGHTCVVSGDSIYVIGGWNNGTILSSVERATLNTDATIATGTVASGFTATGNPALVDGRYAHASVVLGADLVVLGGNDSVGYTSNVEHIALAADGTLSGSWTSLAPGVQLTSARRAPRCAVVGNYVYVLGGYVSGYASSTVERASIDAGGSLGAFAGTGQPSMLTPRYGACAAAVGPYLYVMGGNDGTIATASIEQIKVNPDGSLAPPTNVGVPVQQTARAYAACARIGKYLYVIGGQVGGSATSSVEAAQINADGSLNAFSSTGIPAMVNPRYAHAAFVLGNYLYVLGGQSGTTRADMERSQINADGTLQPFQNTTGVYSLTAARASFGVAVVGTHLYAIGGTGGLTSIENAPINADGTLAGGFTSTVAALPAGRESFATAVLGNTLHVLGGFTTATQGDVWKVGILSDGSLDTAGFSQLTATFTARRDHAAVVIGNYLYVIGGKRGTGSPLGSIERAPLQ